MKYTLDTDFSSLNGPKAANWIMGFQDIVEDDFIDLTNTPLPGGKASDVMNAQEQVYQTPLFRQFIERIQNGLKAALSAIPEQYPALREEYHQYTILPEEYAAKLLGF